MKQKFSIGCDHGAVALKNQLVESLSEKFDIIDEGTYNTDSVDYPDYAKKVCDKVVENQVDFGVLLCTSGIGMSISANKIKGIRAALCHNEDCAEFSKLHNNANVACIGAKYVSQDLAEKIIIKFAQTQFEGGRHARRVEKFMSFEQL